MRPSLLRLMVIWICALMSTRARFILIHLNGNEMWNDKAFDKETVGFKEGGTISSEEETVDVKNGKEFGEIFETRFNPGRHRNFASQFKPGVKENSANRFRSGGKKDFYAGLKNEVDPTPIPQPKSNQNPKLKENNAVKPVPNEQNIDTLRSDPDIHASSQSNLKTTDEPGSRVKARIESKEIDRKANSAEDSNSSAAFRSRAIRKGLPKNPGKPKPKPNPGSTNVNSSNSNSNVTPGFTNKPGVTGPLFGGKNIGEKCSSNQECFSTNCVFGKGKPGKRPPPPPKAKPARKGRKKRAVGKNDTIGPQENPKNGTKPIKTLPLGTCKAEMEQDEVPKDCPAGFKKAAKTYKEEIRDKSAIIFRNYDSKECAEICRDSPGCESFLYRQDMKWGNKKDEENGCFLYYESAAVPASQFKRIGPKAIATNEIACENLRYQKPCRTDKDCLTKIPCVKPKPNPKKPTSKNPAKIQKVCGKTEKPCQTPADCKLRYCQGKICKLPRHPPTCLTNADCKVAPKCIPKPKGKAKPGGKRPKWCKGNEGTECTNDVHCKVEGCTLKTCDKDQGTTTTIKPNPPK